MTGRILVELRSSFPGVDEHFDDAVAIQEARRALLAELRSPRQRRTAAHQVARGVS